MTETVTHMDEFENLKLNSLIGAPPEMKSSSLTISGKNNILYCEDGVVIENSIIRFSGDNSIIVLGSSKHPYKLNATIYNNCSLLIGRNCYFNGPLNVIVSEEQDVVIGNDCLISFGIWVRTADPHLIYDCATCTRINPSRNIVVGDHVWIGQAATILKNTIIGSGSIIGATSLVSGKRIPSNTSWGGNPAKQIRSGVFWDAACVHKYTQADTISNARKDGDFRIFKSGNAKHDIESILAHANARKKGDVDIQTLATSFLVDTTKPMHASRIFVEEATHKNDKTQTRLRRLSTMAKNLLSKK